MKMGLALITASILAASVVNSGATLFQDINYHGQTLLEGQSISGVFDITQPGMYGDYSYFDGPLNFAWVWLTVRDNDNDELATISFDALSAPAPFPITLAFDDGSSIFGELVLDASDPGNYTGAQMGVLGYTIFAESGNFTVDLASFVAVREEFPDQYADFDGRPVPDGGSAAALFGLAVLGMSALRRKVNA